MRRRLPMASARQTIDRSGTGRGVIYVQGEQVRTVCEDEKLDALNEESSSFAQRVERGEVQLNRGGVTIKPPAPLPRADGSLPLTVVT